MLRLLLAALLMAEPQIVCRLGPPDPPYNAYSDQSSSPDALELAGKVNGYLKNSPSEKGSGEESNGKGGAEEAPLKRNIPDSDVRQRVEQL